MKNKSLLILGIIAAILVIAIVSIVIINNKKGDNTNTEISDIINKNSTLPVKYLSKHNKEDNNLKNYEEFNNLMSYDYKDENIAFSYYGYPNDEADYCLGSISLLTNKYNILGVTIGDNMIESISNIENFGFKLEENNDYYTATLNYKDITIEIEANTENDNIDENNAVIGSIQVKAKSKYQGNRAY